MEKHTAKQENPTCPECGRSSREGAAFCDKCGRKLRSAICSACGNAVRNGAKFCDMCGFDLAGASLAWPATAPKAGLSSEDLQVGSILEFGTYIQSFTASGPIEWLVLENNGKTALLVSRYGLDYRPFNDGLEDPGLAGASWRDSDLRMWLNETFFDVAFNAEEKERIADSVLTTGDPVLNLGDDDVEDIIVMDTLTRDKVFCLSIEEARHFFPSDDARKCQATAWSARRVETKGEGCCSYWLRSIGRLFDIASVDQSGAVLEDGFDADKTTVAVRPALRITI